MIRICSNCDDEFETNSPAKKAAGGNINSCPQCAEETTVKYAGVQAADGKQTQATILKFSSEADKKRYVEFWQNTSGLKRGYGGQLSRTAMTDPGVRFQTIVGHIAANHKGRNT